MTAPQRPVRFCPFCEQADDHPRHDYGVGNPRIQPHMDCCSNHGCPDGSCRVLVADKVAVGDEFREQLQSEGFRRKVEVLLEERDEATRTYTSAQAAELLGIDPNTIVPVSMQGVVFE